jgi:hypothetical protein
MPDSKSNYKVYNVENYAQADAKFIQSNFVELSNIEMQ